MSERLSADLDLVLVDEFQDTSPILAIFLRLAIAKRSVWVGDQKQAIFGFRYRSLPDRLRDREGLRGFGTGIPAELRSRPAS